MGVYDRPKLLKLGLLEGRDLVSLLESPPYEVPVYKVVLGYEGEDEDYIEVGNVQEFKDTLTADKRECFIYFSKYDEWNGGEGVYLVVKVGTDVYVVPLTIFSGWAGTYVLPSSNELFELLSS